MAKQNAANLKKIIKYFGKAISLLSIIFIIRAIYTLGFDYSAVDNWAAFLGIMVICVIVKCVSVYISGSAWYGWLSFFSGKKGLLREGVCVYAKANIGKYMPGNVMHYVERNLFADHLGISQKKLAISSVFEVLSLVGVAFIMAFAVSAGQLRDVLHVILIDGNRSCLWIAAVLGVLGVAVLWYVMRNKIRYIREEYSVKDFVIVLLRNMCLYAVTLILLGLIMVVLFYYLGGECTWANTLLIISGYIIAWVLGFIVPGAPGGIGVRELVITLLLGGIAGEGLVVTLSVSHRLITIIGDFLAYLVMLFIRPKKP